MISAPLLWKAGFLIFTQAVVALVSVFSEGWAGSHWGNAPGVLPHSLPLAPPDHHTLLPPSSCHVAPEHASYPLETFKPYFAWLRLGFVMTFGLIIITEGFLPASLSFVFTCRFPRCTRGCVFFFYWKSLATYFSYLPCVFSSCIPRLWSDGRGGEAEAEAIFRAMVGNSVQFSSEFYSRLSMQTNSPTIYNKNTVDFLSTSFPKRQAPKDLWCWTGVMETHVLTKGILHATVCKVPHKLQYILK